jgi:hypothetical protein
VLLAVGPSFYRNALAYGSNLERWGVHVLLVPPAATAPDPAVMPAAAAYHAYAKYPLLALILGWAVVARRLRRWDRYEVAAVALGLFLVFAPGFGVQYTALVLPLMFAVRPAAANVYSAAAGVFVAAAYLVTLQDTFPYFSHFPVMLPQPVPWVGLVAWTALAYFVVAVIARPGTGDREPKPV